MKKIIPAISIIFLFFCTSLYSQTKTNWVYVGKTQIYEVYYVKNSVVRGTYTYVAVIGKCLKTERDPNGKEYIYASATLIFYKSTYGDMRCILTDKRFYYSDNDYAKSIEPKIEYIVGSVKILNDIWNKIK